MSRKHTLKELTQSDLNVRRSREAPQKKKSKNSKYDALLEKFPLFSQEFIERIQHDFFESIVNILIEEVDHTSFTEDDPLLLIAPNMNDQDSIAYWNSGNYGLPAASPGARPWPGIFFKYNK